MLFSKKRSCSAWPRVPGSIHQTDSISCKVGVQHSARVPVLVGREEPLHRASPGGTIAKTTRALDALRIIYIWKYTDDSQTSPLPLYAQLPSPVRPTPLPSSPRACFSAPPVHFGDDCSVDLCAGGGSQRATSFSRHGRCAIIAPNWAACHTRC